MTNTESKTTSNEHTFDASQNMEKESWTKKKLEEFEGLLSFIEAHAEYSERERLGTAIEESFAEGEKAMLARVIEVVEKGSTVIDSQEYLATVKNGNMDDMYDLGKKHLRGSLLQDLSTPTT